MKKETIEEFLARGGQIIKLPTTPREPEKDSFSVNSTAAQTGGSPSVILTYSDADLYYGEVRHRKSKKPAKAKPAIDFSALPEAIRNKYLKGKSDDE